MAIAILNRMRNRTTVCLDKPSQVRPSLGLPSPSIRAARSFTSAVIQSYWTLVTQGRINGPCAPEQFGVPVSDLQCPKKLQALAQIKAVELAALDFIDASFEIGHLFTSLLPADYRSQHGIYFTPPALTTRLLDLSETAGIRWENARVLDPACGGGAFLAPVIARKCLALKDRPATEIFESITQTVRGFELDPFSAWLSQVFADIAALDVCVKVGKRLPRIVEVRDTLLPLSPEFQPHDLVIGNPPYSKVKLDKGQRQYYARSLYGHSNLYGLFTDQALRLCADNGVIAFVTPTSFLGGEYFKNLRALLRTVAHPLNVEFISDRAGVFENVLQETLLATYRKSRPNGSVAVRLLGTDGHRVTARKNLGRFALPDQRQEPWLLPRSPAQALLMRQASQLPNRLKDYGYAVSTGPLVWNRHKSQRAHTEGKDTYPLIWAESVTANGRFEFKANRKNHALYFRVKKPRDNWLLVTRSCALLQRTTAKEQPRRLILTILPDKFIRKHGAVVVENHLNMLRSVVEEPPFSIEVITALLNSQCADDLFRCINGSVAVSAYELEALPLPAPDCLKQIATLLGRNASKEAIERVIENGYLNANNAAAA